MPTTRNVAVLVGSLRKESFSRKTANALIELAPPGLRLAIVEIRDLPLYNQDDDANPPPASAAFKQKIMECDAGHSPLNLGDPSLDTSLEGIGPGLSCRHANVHAKQQPQGERNRHRKRQHDANMDCGDRRYKRIRVAFSIIHSFSR